MRSMSKILGLAALVAAGFIALPMPASAQTAKVQIGVPTKAYWSTIVIEAALRNKLFEKEGISAELTIYKGGAEELEGLAAGAADIIQIAPLLVSIGRNKGVAAKMIGGGNRDYAGWHMLVPPNSKIAKVEDLAGKNVAITLHRRRRRCACAVRAECPQGAVYARFRRRWRPGAEPDLGAVDAVVVPPPLSYNLLKTGEARSIMDFSKDVPVHQAGGWTTTEKQIKDRPEVIQKALNAIYGGLLYLNNNPDFAIKLIAEIDEIPMDIAALEYQNGIKSLPLQADITAERVAAAFELNKLVGATGLIPPVEAFTDQFFTKMVPTKP